jgi:aspartate carbamoyltransferase catalytic subunit
MKSSFNHRNLLTTEDLTIKDIENILTTAEKYHSTNSNKKILNDKNIVNLFFENSTRTIVSFELAAKKLGANVINITVNNSSVNKGESILDTVKTIDAMQPDFIIIRHNASGIVASLAGQVNSRVINGGDGSHQHPTQALLDAYTIKKNKGKIKGLSIAICGDILHSRVARSNIDILTKMGAVIRLIAPKTLLPINTRLQADIYHDMKHGLRDVDIIMMLRIQKERMQHNFIPSSGEVYKFYGLDEEKLSHAKPDALVMHPGPVNLGIEICSKVAAGTKSLLLQQVENGVAVRQAVFELLVRN